MKTISLFISYAHKDNSYKEELVSHLKALERKGQIKIWEDGAIIAGTDWDATIKRHLAAAEIVLFLISSDFINSDYIDRVEVKEAIANHQAGKQILIPIVIRACDFSSFDQLSRFQALPRHAKPVSSWSDRDEAWLDVVNGLKRVFSTVAARPAATPIPTATIAPSTTSISSLEKEALQKQATLLVQKLARLQEAQILETDPSRLFKLEHDIRVTKEALQKIKEQLA